MRANCTICSDLFDGDETNPVAAIHGCGHTFHDSCLAQWLAQSATCPQCRKKVTKKGVIHKLYFDQLEDGADAPTPSKLQNEVGSLKTSLRAKNMENNKLLEEKECLKLELAELTREKDKLEKKVQTERTATSSLQKELSWFRSQQEMALQAQEESKRLQERLDTLTSIQTVVQGLEEDVQDMISNQGDVKQLAKWCSVLKKELSTKRKDCKQLKEQVDRLSKDGAMRRRDIREKTQENSHLKDKLQTTEDDLKQAETEIASLKKKLTVLKDSIASPTSTASSLANRFICESPAPMPLSKKPKLTLSLSDNEEVDLDVTPDLFSPEKPPVEPSPTTQTKKECQEFGTQFIKFSKAASNNKKRQRDMSDISNSLPLNMNIFKKPAPGSSGIMKKGYNGLGGHATYIQPSLQPRPTGLFKKPAKASLKMRNLGPAPALPSLDI